MKTIIFFFSFILLLTVACDTSQKSTQEKPGEPALYSYDIQKITDRETGCNTPECTRIVINYPAFSEGKAVHTTLNEVIKKEVKRTVSDYLMEEASPAASIDQLTSAFLKSYEKFKKEFPTSTTPWDLSVDVIVSYTTPSFVSLSFNTSSYTGGAHPNHQVAYLNLDQKGNKITELSSFFTDIDQLKEKAEQKFRKEYDLKPAEDLSEAGFMFDDNTFELTDNFGFSKAGVVFYYNSYEIASYAQGPTAILIPFEELKGIFEVKI